MASKPKGAPQELSNKSQLALKAILLCVARKEQEVEILRLFLCSNVIFEPYAAFQRLDRAQEGFITPLNFLNFLRDNGVTEFNEADCYYFVKFFDADEDGKLTYPEFLQIILPCTNSKIRAETTQRPSQSCKPTDFLTMDVEQDLARLFKMEILMHRESETLKQRFESHADYSADLAFKSVDRTCIGFIDIKILDNFFKSLQSRNITVEDNAAIIRRFDLDCDNRLKRDEFLKGIASQEPYSKMLVRNQLKQEENFGIEKKKKEEEQKKRKEIEALKKRDPKAVKAHNEIMATKFNQVQKFDRDFENVSGVSPIRYRHEMDLYGLKDGTGKFCPIMVENVNKIPEPEEFEDPEVLKKQKDKEQKSATKKSSEKKPPPAAKKPTILKEKSVKPGAKLVLTNQRKAPEKDYSQFVKPGTFQSKYSEYQIKKQQGFPQDNDSSNRTNRSSNRVQSRKSDGPLAVHRASATAYSPNGEPGGIVQNFQSPHIVPSQLYSPIPGIPGEGQHLLHESSYQRSSLPDQPTSLQRAFHRLNNDVPPPQQYQVEPQIQQTVSQRYNEDYMQNIQHRTGSQERFSGHLSSQGRPLSHMQPSQNSLDSNPAMGGSVNSIISQQSRDQLERAKVDLASKTDFNLIDAFRIFDVEGRGWISAEQIVDSMHQCLSFFVSLQDVTQFLKVFDKNQDGRLKYSEFCDAFLPLDTVHASRLAQKPPQEKFKEVDQFAMEAQESQHLRAHMFSRETNEAFLAVWKVHLRICATLE